MCVVVMGCVGEAGECDEGELMVKKSSGVVDVMMVGMVSVAGEVCYEREEWLRRNSDDAEEGERR